MLMKGTIACLKCKETPYVYTNVAFMWQAAECEVRWMLLNNFIVTYIVPLAKENCELHFRSWAVKAGGQIHAEKQIFFMSSS